MFRIFRRIRKDILGSPKTNRYLFYAAGELLLVIVGILIALQINNWNEERIEQKEIREYALSLSAAIERDMEMLLPVEMQIRASIRQAEELASYIRDRTVEEMGNADLFFLSTHIGYRPYGWNRAALEQLKTAGGLRRMQNKHLAERISDYDALTRHLDQDYREDEESARAILDLINKLVDLNYDPDGLEEILTWDDGFTAAYIEERLTRFRETGLYKRLSEMKKPLLSQDLAEFRRLANLNREFAGSAEARPDIELPRLRQFAAEIQALIDEEYH
ncbi:MAG: hypothetical protein AMS22_09390 [Thiotrichales bacterium SG8_50]|jgi:hypothetical protein|nr:MAG: hypothetical protein AMS22_09390 [Thiotrichales bacterium SG8_50]